MGIQALFKWTGTPWHVRSQVRAGDPGGFRQKRMNKKQEKTK